MVMETAPAAAKGIRTEPRPKCLLCGETGSLLYGEQKDRLFGVEGTWNIKECVRPSCRLVWLDPMPVPEDLGNAYVNYYTHRSAPAAEEPQQVGLAKKVFRAAKRAYLLRYYGYQLAERCSFPGIGSFMYLLPHRRRRIDLEVRFVPAVPQGRLLDLGCGSGEWLAHMSKLGWTTEGVDFDADAVRLGKQRGLSLRLGSVEQQEYPSNHFDAIMLSHVLEHLPDPVGTLTECARILKPGGRFVAFTPNPASLGHWILKSHWRGLEPPRHLYLFRAAGVTELLQRAKLQLGSIRSFNSLQMWAEGWALKTSGRRQTGATSTPIAARALGVLEELALALDPECGEWLAITAFK